LKSNTTVAEELRLCPRMAKVLISASTCEDKSTVIVTALAVAL